jgi:hypothetical protein
VLHGVSPPQSVGAADTAALVLPRLGAPQGAPFGGHALDGAEWYIWHYPQQKSGPRHSNISRFCLTDRKPRGKG